jgi:hypothetical protein
MIVIVGYHNFGLTVEEAQARYATKTTEVPILTASSQKNGWQVKINIPGRELAMKGAVGFLDDKMGYWYIIDLKMESGELSFTAVKDNSSERHAFSLKLAKNGEYWGMMGTVNQSPKSEWAVNCRVFEAADLSVPFDLPEAMFERPKLLN